MAITMVHPQIVNGYFARRGGLAIRHAASEAEAEAYFLTELEAPLRRRAQESIEFYRDRATAAASMQCALPTAGGSATSPTSAVLPESYADTIDIADPCSVHFYDCAHFRGESFRLGGLHDRAIDSDLDLAQRRRADLDGGWSEAISSVDTGNLVGAVLLFDRPFFRGDRLEVWCDISDLTRVPQHGYVGHWSDRACSVACAGVDVPRTEVLAHCGALR